MISEKLQVSLYNPATAQYGQPKCVDSEVLLGWKFDKSKPNSHESY